MAVAALSVGILILAAVYQISRALLPSGGDVVADGRGAPASQNLAPLDSDSDGWEDWEEIFAGTNPNDPQSNPSFSRGAQDGRKPSGSEFIAATIYSHTEALRNGVSPQTLAGAFESELASFIKGHTEYRKYTAADIKATPDISAESAETYRDAMRDAAEPLLGLQYSELSLYGEFLVTQDPSVLVELALAADVYEKVALAMATVTVPQDAVNIHVAAANSLLHFASTLRAVVDSEEDPLGAYTFLEAFNDAEENMVGEFAKLGEYYVKKEGRITDKSTSI